VITQLPEASKTVMIKQWKERPSSLELLAFGFESLLRQGDQGFSARLQRHACDTRVSTRT
jgi:hypothetical protein